MGNLGRAGGAGATALAPPPELLLAVAHHRHELQLLQVRIARLESVLAEHGITPPGSDPRLGASDAEHLKQCRAVVRAAYALLDELDGLRELVGSGSELLEEEPWR